MMKKQSNQMQKLLLSLLPIQAFAVGLPAINSLLDGFVVGHFYGTEALAAIGFAGPLTYIFTMIGSTLANGSQIISGQYLGRGDHDGLSHVFNSTSLFAMAIGLAVSALLMIFSGGISFLLGSSKELTEMTRSYILGMAPSVLFSVLFSSLLSFLQLERAEKVSTAAVIVMLVVNTGFNLLNVFVLKWGLLGIGLSTSLANLAAAAVCLPYFLKKSSLFRFSIRRFRIRALKDVIYQGIPSAVSPACSFFRDRLINYVVFSMGGTPAMAAMAIAVNLSNGIGVTVEGGYSGSANLIANVLVGERDIESLRELPKNLITTLLPIYLIAYALLFAFARPLAYLFGAETEHIALYVTVIRCYNLWYITNTLKTPPITIYRALGRVKLVSLFYVLAYLAFPAFTCLLSRFVGIGLAFNYSWISELCLTVAYAVYYYMKRRKMPRSVFRMTDIPNTLAVPSADRCGATIRNVSDATSASAAVVEFCKSKDLSERTAVMCGLCVEEMAVDSIVHGFVKGKKDEYSIELRVIYEDGGVSVMLRDNCPHFDPKEWLAMYSDQDPDRCLGIRLAAECAKEMNYTPTLGLNVINIRI